MELSELVAYAGETYQIREEHKWADFPGFSVLCHPQTGKWIALLMRQWDSETGTEIERCDLKCGDDILLSAPPPYLAPAIRMHGNRWVNVMFDERTEPGLVIQLFDRAVRSNAPHGYTVVLDSQVNAAERVYQDTALPFAGEGRMPPKEKIPERIRELRRMFEYGRESEAARAESFYRQAVFMQDYEDDVAWESSLGRFAHFFPTYRDMSTQQLRGYFTWRTGVRKGEYRPIATSAAYLYLYELLNGVGADSPADALKKLREFEAGFLDSGVGNEHMRSNLRRWMLEFAVLNDLPPELAREAAPPDLIARDTALAALREAEQQSDESVFSALCTFSGKKLEESPVLAADPARGKHLFAAAWRSAASAFRRQGKDLFAQCFGEPATRSWYPLSNAVYRVRSRPKERDYALDSCRSYRCRYGVWVVTAYEKLSFNRTVLQGFVHEADARLRRYLKTGRYLRESAADAWAIPYIDAVIEADRKAVFEASRPKITIDFTDLDRIRKDAAGTRDSLLTEEEMEEPEAPATAPEEPEEQEEQEAPKDPALPLDNVQTRILRALLSGGDAAQVLRECHLMPSIAADFINEAFYDEIGDTVVSCEGDRLTLVEDYVEDLTRLLGGR